MGAEVMLYDVYPLVEEKYQQVELTDINSVALINFDVDYIFMFAGLSGTYAGFDNYPTYNAVNEFGLVNLLNSIRKSSYRPKVIFPSTRLVYKGSERPLKESAEKECRSIYAVNKLAAEGLLQAYYYSFDIPYTVFRLGIPFGNLFPDDYSYGTVGFFVKQATKGNNITIFGDGEVKRTFTYIEDACYQIVNVSKLKQSDNQVYNVCGGDLSLRQAADIIARKYGVDVVSVPYQEKDIRIETGHTFFDDTKIRSLLGDIKYISFEDYFR